MTDAATTTVGDVLRLLDGLFPPATAESWDAVGLVTGDPERPCARVHLAVDPVQAVVDEAVAAGADLIVTHHPLLLRGVHGIAETTAKGRLLATLVRAGTALHTAHTNADVADPGVSDALAARFGLLDTRPLQPLPAPALDTLATFVPVADTARVLAALADAGAGRIGDYDRCGWWTAGTGTFRPGPGAQPVIGAVGVVEQVPEDRLQVVLPRGRRSAVLAALRASHPYEEPAFDLVEHVPLPGRTGLGRVGALPTPMTLAELVSLAARVLPATASGIRAAGDPGRLVSTLAVSGGAGDSLLGAATSSGAQAFLTADLRHHPAREHLDDGGPALLDAAHWATEQPWLEQLAGQVAAALPDTVVTVSALVTDPWSLHAPSPERS